MGRYPSSENFKPIDEIPGNPPEHVRRAIADYNQEVSKDTRPILEADRIAREERQHQAQLALQRTTQDLERVKRAHETLGGEVELMRPGMAAEKALLLQQIAANERSIKQIQDDETPE